MNLYRCTECGKQTLSWDSRSGAFLCLARDCTYFVYPPAVVGDSLEATRYAIATGRLSILQAWIDRQARPAQ